jgi:DNA-binding NarL/FixJ family response regulator
LKDLEAEQFFEAIDAVAHGESVIPAQLARHLWTEFGRIATREPAAAEADSLTEREWEVLRLVAAGHTNREIANRLVITENTVKFHMRGILDKLHLRNRTEVAAWVAEPTGRPGPILRDTDHPWDHPSGELTSLGASPSFSTRHGVPRRRR